MMDKLSEALQEISSRKIAEAGNMKKRRPIPWISAVAAVVALAILAAALIPRSPGRSPSTITIPSTPALLAMPIYPEMAAYPDESAFVDPITRVFDDEGFRVVYEAWEKDQALQKQQPAGYADSLTAYFRESIPAFLDESGENIVCSPLNVYMALALLAESTSGSTRAEILTLLNADSLESLRAQAGSVWNSHYCADGASTCLLANSLWLDSGIPYHKETADTLAEQYYAAVYQGDLGSDAMNQELRDWLDSQTQGLLEEATRELTLTDDALLALASTVCYRAKWDAEFSEGSNLQGVFHAPGGDREVTYMRQTMTYGPYFWGEDFGAVYRLLEDGSRMWLVLPDEGLTPADLLESGHAMELILGDSRNYVNQKTMKVHLSLPKFDISSNNRLEDALKELGVKKVFSLRRADFTALLPESDAFLSTVQHAARVCIDEEGVTAAAYTVMLGYGAAMPPEDEIDFVLNRPFLFVITSHDNLPLFAGVVNEP